MQVPLEIEIGRPRADELDRLPRIELKAAKLFSPEDLCEQPGNAGFPVSFFESALSADRLWVARTGSPPELVGFAVAVVIDGSAHLHEMDILPSHGRRGIGRRLLQHVASWAKSQGYPSLTLVTFRHVPWNAPFYRSAGFVEIPDERIGPELRGLMLEEERRGLDPKKRVGMILDLSL